jgi:phosphoribosylformimino-5-aminoimidazole carboxamide ribotide isomerase
MAEAAWQRKIVVSMDMLLRKIQGRDPDLSAQAPLPFLRRLNGLSLQAVILLELDRVGTCAGLDRMFLEEAAAVSEHPLILGGGVKGEEDLQTLEDLGFSGALVATAVHNGKIPVEMVR